MSVNAQQGVGTAGAVGLAIATGGTSAIVMAAVAVAGLAIAAIKDGGEHDATNWHNKTLPLTPDQRMITYLQYIETLPYDSGDGHDTRAGRIAQYEEFYGSLSNSNDERRLSYEVAKLWNDTIDADTARNPVAFSGGNDIQKYKKNLANTIQPPVTSVLTDLFGNSTTSATGTTTGSKTNTYVIIAIVIIAIVVLIKVLK